VHGAEMAWEWARQQEGEAKKQREYIEQRDRLSGQSKVDFVLERIQHTVGLYRASFQREILEQAANCEPVPPDGKPGAYPRKLLAECLEGTGDGFRRTVTEQYLTTILPPLEAKQAKDDALEAAVDEFKASLHGRTYRQRRSSHISSAYGIIV
jgi:hypothetical protein